MTFIQVELCGTWSFVFASVAQLQIITDPVFSRLRVCACQVPSVVFISATLWTLARHAPLSIGFSRQAYWSGLPCPPPGDPSNRGIESVSLCLLQWQVGSLPLVPPGKPLSRLYSPSFLSSLLLFMETFGLCLLKQSIGLHRLADMCLCGCTQVCWGGR